MPLRGAQKRPNPRVGASEPGFEISTRAMEAKAAKAGQTVLWREKTFTPKFDCPPKCDQKRVVSAGSIPT